MEDVTLSIPQVIFGLYVFYGLYVWYKATIKHGPAIARAELGELEYIDYALIIVFGTIVSIIWPIILLFNALVHTLKHVDQRRIKN